MQPQKRIFYIYFDIFKMVQDIKKCMTLLKKAPFLTNLHQNIMFIGKNKAADFQI